MRSKPLILIACLFLLLFSVSAAAVSGAVDDYNKLKKLEVTSATDSPTISKAVPIKITSGDDSATGTGEVVLDWTNINDKTDIAVYDESGNLYDYTFESFDATAETAVIWVYDDWARDGSVQLKVGYGNGPSDQSVAASTVFDKESNLVAGYLLNETSGDALDVTSNNNDGTVNGATQGVTGIVDGAYGFDGETNNVVVSTIDLDTLIATGDFFISAWVKRTDTNSYGRQFVVSSTDGNWIIPLSVGDNSDGSVLGFQDTDTGGSPPDNFGTWYNLGGNIETGVWHHIAVVYDDSASELKGYVDGVETGSQSNIELASSYSDMAIANRVSISDDGLIGSIDYVTGKNDAVSSEYIESLYAATKSSPDFFSQQSAETANAPPQYANEQPPNASTGVPLPVDLKLDVTDPDGDNMNVTFRDASDDSIIGTDTNVPNGSTATVEWAGLEQATTYRWFANVSDGDAYNVTGTYHYTTGQTLDSPPVVVSTQVSNTSPQANERITFNATCQDRDQTNFTGFCRVHFNGTAGNLTSVSPVYNDTSTEFCSVTTANNSKGHSYFAEVWCEDENGNASHVNTSEATVIDTPPEAPDDILFPGDIKVSKDLNATAVGGYDIDGDPITYYYRYENLDDSTSLKNWSGNNSYIINQSDAHDQLFVSAKSVTPDANSSPINRSPQVQNTIPIIQAVRNNTQGVVETPVTYNLSITDIDGDSPYDIDVSVRTDSAPDVFARLDNISSQEQFNISVPAEYNGDTELYFQASDAYGGNSNYSTDRLHLYGANVTVKFYDETGGSIDIGGYSVFSCADQKEVSTTTEAQHYLLNCTPEWYEFRQNNTELSRRYVVGPGTFTQDVYMFDALVTEAIPKPIDVDDMFDEDVYVLRYGTVVHSEHQDSLGRIYPFLAYGRRYQIGVMQDGEMTTIGEVTATDDSLLVTYLSSYDTDLREESYYKDISIQSGFTENGIYINYTDASETTEYVEATIQYLDNGTYEQSYVSRVNYKDQVMFLHPFTENESRLKNVTQWRITVESKTTYGTLTEKTYLSYLEDLALPGVGAAIKTIIGLGVVILIAGLFTVQNGEIGVMFASAVLMVFKTIGLFQYPDFMVYGIGSLFFLLGVFALLKRHGVL